MNIICLDIKDYEEILPDLKRVLERLSENLIGEGLLWI